MVVVIVLILAVVAFAWNLGVHYTGAVMGMPYAARSVALWPALAIIAVFTVLGATFASGRVEVTVGQHIIDERFVSIADAVVIVLAAGGLTAIFNYARTPTSTIQILVFCVIGVALRKGIPIHWATIGALAIVWAIAPIAAFVLGFLFTHLLDLIVPLEAARAQVRAQTAPSDTPAGRGHLERWFPGVRQARRLSADVRVAAETSAGELAPITIAAWRLLPILLVLVGVLASFVLGANDVSNATGAFILTNLFSLRTAGFIGGVAMAVGALTWGRRILQTVAFDVVRMDIAMASAAQGVQGLVVLAAVTQGFFTSMNQALIGAMAGTGLARGRGTVQRKQITGILLAWLIGPVSGLALAYALEWLLQRGMLFR